MPDTPIYNWPMPTVQGSTGTWGSELNALFTDHIETKVKEIEDLADEAMPKAGGEFTGQIEIETERLTVSNLGSVSGTTNIDLSAAHYFSLTRGGNTTLTLSNWPAGTHAFFVFLEITNGGAGAFTWPGGILWNTGVAPQLVATGVDGVVLFSRDGGSTIRGTHAYTRAS